MSVINNNLLMTPEGYQISRSVRLRSSASAYFNRTTGTATSTTTWTWSGWVKRGSLGTQVLFSGGTAANNNAVIAFSSDCLDIYNYVSSVVKARKTTTQVFRDPSAWYHIVVAASGSTTLNVYVNGVQVTAFSASTTPDGSAWLFQSGTIRIGSDAYAVSALFDGYLTEINFIDGQALTPSSFGETDAVTGVWKPKKYAGTYGTNGFYLNFSDNSNNTAATIGKDYSGNGNNWTPNNISVTSGVTYDSMLDTPTPYADGGNGRGNYAVLNPVNKALYQPTISDGNLRVAPTTTQYQNVFSTVSQTSGKWYCEVVVNGTPNSANMIGVSSVTEQNYLITNAGLIGATSSGYGYYIYNGNKYNNGSSSAYGNSISSGDIVGIAIDLDNGKVWFSKNGTWQTSGDPTAGTNAAFTGLTSSLGFFISSSSYSGGATSFDHNFGQRPFSYTPPTGFKALNTQNLPDSTIKKGNAYFDATTYTGTGSSLSITNSGSMQPDLVWVKGRSGATDHALYDAVRGVQLQLESNTTTAETTETTGLTAFNSNGFTVGALAQMNTSSATYVGWQWKESATAGFDIVTYTGNGTSGKTVSHSLGVTPAMIITKSRDSFVNSNWSVYHQSLGATKGLILNLTDAAATSAVYWNNTAPTSTQFTLGSSAQTNNNLSPFIAYCFAEVAGFSKFGSYTGNGSTDGVFVYCGFRPRYVLVKASSAVEGWVVWDSARDTYNAMPDVLYPNGSNAEVGSTQIDFLSNGFKLRNSATNGNISGNTYIFAAFAENPFKNSLAR